MPLVTERWSPPKFDKTTSAYRAAREFDVTGVVDQNDAISAVNNFDSSTVFNAKHPLSQWAYVDGLECRMAGFNFFRVSVGYSSTPAGRHPDPGNPLSEPVEYEWDWELDTEGCVMDCYGNAIMNTAGQSFSSDPPTNVLNGTLIAIRNEPYYNAQAAVAYANAVNSSPFTFGPNGIWTVDQGQANMKIIKCLSIITTASLYARVMYQIKVKRGVVKDSDGYWDAFKIRILNQGTRGWCNYNGKTILGPLLESTGINEFHPVSYPVLLDPFGVPIQPAYQQVGVSFGPAGGVQAIPNPKQPPSTTIIEAAGDDDANPDAYFLKVFPQTVNLIDLNMLGL